MKLSAQDMTALETALAPLFLKLFPADQRFAVDLSRLLARGKPVAPGDLAEKLESPIGKVEETLGRWPGVSRDGEGNVIAFWGLSLKPTSHALVVDGVRLYAWCSWDTLFIPDILGKPARVESTCPVSGSKITLTVTPGGVADVEPGDAVTSFLTTDAPGIIDNVVANFCHFVYFFPSPETAQSWISQNPGTFLMSIADAYALGRRKNQVQYPDVLAVSSQESPKTGSPTLI